VLLEQLELQNNMKSNSLLIASALAAVSSAALVNASPAAAGIVFAVAAMLAVGIQDYGRPARRLAALA
jgi:hypothetical protein